MGSTTNFGLTYPDGSAPPCEGAQQIEQLAEDYQASVAQLLDESRNMINTPVGRARWTSAAVTLAASAPLRADTVDVDTGGFLDLTVFPDRITFPYSGRYLVGAGAVVTARQATGTTTLSFSGGPAIGTSRWDERTPGDFRVAIWGHCIATAGNYQQFLLAASDGGDSTVSSMLFWAIWIGDQ